MKLSTIEKWKNIKGFEGYYQISNLGQIKRVARKRDGSKLIEQAEKILKPSVKKGGKFLSIQLYKGDYKKVEFIHRLVAVSFVRLNRKLGYIKFIDGNYLNCKADNLVWVERSVLFRRKKVES